MSLILTLYGNDSIVMASDSRLTTTLSPTVTENENGIKTIETVKGIFTTDTAQKTFLCPNGCGISFCGDASAGIKSMETILKDFIRSKINRNDPIMVVPQRLLDFIHQNYPTISPSFQIAGYVLEEEEYSQKVYGVYSDGRKDAIVEYETKEQAGAVANGESSYIASLWSDTNWGKMTIQDKIDYCRYAIELTAKTMQYKNVLQTVGGPIEILVIEPTNAKWIQHKKVR